MSPASLLKRSAILLAVHIMLFAACSASADDGRRIVKSIPIPHSGQTVVVAEGDLESRSIGSYSVRLYAKNDPAYPYDRFLSGLVRPRNGVIQEVKLAHLGNRGAMDIIVITRYAGSGHFVTAEAFGIRQTSLKLLTSIAGLDAQKDAIQALKQKLGHTR